MPDDDQAQATPDAEGSDAARSRRRTLLLYGAIALGSFLFCGTIALALGGHFGRQPLARLRSVPLLGALIPEPEPAEEPPEAEPDSALAALQTMPVEEMGTLIDDLKRAQQTNQARRHDLEREAERVRALTTDLDEDRKLLDALRTQLLEERQQLDDERKALRAEAIVASSEERTRLKKLARYFEAQEPERAAAELEELDKTGKGDIAVKTLEQMQEKKAAKIFDVMKPDAAARLKEKISRLRYRDTTPEVSLR